MAESLPGVLHLARGVAPFNAERDVLAGPWCLTYGGAEFLAYDETGFIDPFPDEDSRDAVRILLGGLVARKLGELTLQLNQRHGVCHSPAFWHMILANWLVELGSRVLVRLALYRLLLERHRDRALEVPITTRGQSWNLESSQRFIRALQFEPAFSWWIDSQIVEALAPATWQLRPVGGPETPGNLLGGDPELAVTWRKWLRYSLAWGDVVGPRWQGLLIAIMANLPWAGRRDSAALGRGLADPHLQSGDPLLEELFDRLVQQSMPRSFRDLYPDLERQARRVLYRKGRLRIGVLNRWNDMERIVAALAEERGERIVQHQHGGYNLGFSRSTPSTWEAEYRTYAFFSWGWSGQHDYAGRFIPLPSPWLCRFRNRHRFRDPSLVLVGGPIRLNMTRLNSEPNIAQTFGMWRRTTAFLKALPPHVQNRVIYRPYRNSPTDVDDAEVVRAALPHAPLLTGNLMDALLGCRLHVAEAPTTTLCITMAANVPTICYWDASTWPLSRQAEEAFSMLREAGLFMEDPGMAADWVGQQWETVEEWWRSARVQSARDRWVRQYARTARTWWVDWLRGIRQIA